MSDYAKLRELALQLDLIQRVAANVKDTQPEWSAALTATLDALAQCRADAERYRWLRKANPDAGPSVSESKCNDWGNWYHDYYTGDELDEAIDRARTDTHEHR